uniref:putative manganese-dependent inorganic diphosphatase n=1 Tax=Intestinibacter bartlettii TaxID=261299 RepID=UPI003AB6015A
MSLLVFGHKNPDTDSICSAISLAHLKNELGVEATPYALGEVRKEAQYALDYFGVKAPKVLEDVKIQVKDLSYDKVKSLKPSDSVLNAYNTMIEKGTKTLPVVSVDGKFEGIITMVEIAKSLMYQHFRKVNIPLENVCYNLKGEVLVQCNDVFDGRVTTLSYGMEEIMNLLSEGDIAIVGNRYDIIEYAIDTKVSLLILTGKATLNDELTALAKANGVTVISVDVDTYTASNLINQCAEIEDIITRENLVLFNENDYVDDVKETMLSTNFRAYPVVDDNSKFLGLVSRRHLLNPTKKNVVLVDHNEFAQSADGIEQANIVEIVDHHKIGGISTDLPISVRVSPVGCCSTIIYNLYKENNVEVPKHIAGLLLSAILSDTLIFKSPT